MAIDPTGQDLKNFLSAPDSGEPVVMLNLLRFKEDGGRDRYEQYLRATGPFLAHVGGSLVYSGLGGTALIGEPGQAWDAVLLVRYPSRAAFIAMVSNPEYQKITHLRTEALVEAVLEPTKPWMMP